MATTLENTPITLSPNELATFQGWTISDNIAYHSPCFGGYITLLGIEVVAGETYVIKYKVEEYVSGDVCPIVGGEDGTTESSIGWKTATIVVPDPSSDLSIKFYSDGELAISSMSIYKVVEDPDNAVTLAFNSANNRWTTYYSWKPQMMLKFVNDFFSWSEGRLWKHNVNPIRNNFYGVQYDSQVEIILNVQPTEVKNLYSMRVNANLAWSVTNVYIRPIVGKEDGQRSRIKKGNFVKIGGQWFADFLRDMNDPLFNNELDALIGGAVLQGTVASIRLVADDTTENRLVSVDVLGASQQYTY